MIEVEDDEKALVAMGLDAEKDGASLAVILMKLAARILARQDMPGLRKLEEANSCVTFVTYVATRSRQ